jgi:hypothetical protein
MASNAYTRRQNSAAHAAENISGSGPLSGPRLEACRSSVGASNGAARAASTPALRAALACALRSASVRRAVGRSSVGAFSRGVLPAEARLTAAARAPEASAMASSINASSRSLSA